MATNSKLIRSADNIRILAAAMVEKAKSGHPGGAMGGADFINVLYAEFLRYDPDERTYPFRDRFFLDPGHMAPMLYATLSLAGAYTSEELQQLRQWGSPTPGHPEVDVARGVENTSGPLGQGHAMGLGAAIAERFLVARFGEWMAHRTFAYISDGGVEEEVSQGVGRIAGHLGLNNFIMYYDANNVQLSTRVDEVDTENVAMKYEAWGWNVLTIDGHDVDAIRAALTAACDERERPTLIIGRTVMGRGAKAADGTSFEDKVSTHGQPLTAARGAQAATHFSRGAAAPFPISRRTFRLPLRRAVQRKSSLTVRPQSMTHTRHGRRRGCPAMRRSSGILHPVCNFPRKNALRRSCTSISTVRKRPPTSWMRHRQRSPRNGCCARSVSLMKPAAQPRPSCALIPWISPRPS